MMNDVEQRTDKGRSMKALEEFDRLLPHMTPAEKAQALQRLAPSLAHAFPGIESARDVCGGEPCILRTRIPVWVLVQARRQGTSEADILRSYPSLCAEDLVNAWAYYREQRDEIDQQILDNESA